MWFDQYDDEDDGYEGGGNRRDNGHFDTCDCRSCSDEDALFECGKLPDHLGGGCQLAGSEFCSFECPVGRRL